MIRKNRFKWVDKKFKNFLFNFFSEKFQFKYRNQIRKCSVIKKKTFHLSILDLKMFEPDLYLYLMTKPLECMNCFEYVINTLIKTFADLDTENNKVFKTIQLLLISSEKPVLLKKLDKADIEKLLTLEIKVLAVSRLRIKVDNLKRKNLKESFQKILFLNSNIVGDRILEKINEENSFLEKNIVLCKADFTDYQILKVRDFANFKRNNGDDDFFFLLLERELVGQILPGKVLKVTGVFIMNNFFPDKRNLHLSKKEMIRVLGFQNYSAHQKLSILRKEFLFDEEFLKFTRSKNIYNWVISTICPEISGHNHIKAGLAILIFGCQNQEFDNSINNNNCISMIIVGEDEFFKNSFFNFIRKLTMVLSCDFNWKDLIGYEANEDKQLEFDEEIFFSQVDLIKKKTTVICIRDLEKLNNEDLLKISNIMDANYMIEFQKIRKSKTIPKISILSTISNKHLKKSSDSMDNNIIVNFSHLSSFDLIFSIKQKKNSENDKKMTRYFLRSKKKDKKMTLQFSKLNQISFEMLQKYIRFTSFCTTPTLSENGLKILRNAYLFMRVASRSVSKNKSKYDFTITIRQLESLIKVAEILARMKMGNTIATDDIIEAVRLFQKRFFL